MNALTKRELSEYVEMLGSIHWMGACGKGWAICKCELAKCIQKMNLRAIRKRAKP